MKIFLNIIIALFMIWFLLISETQDIELLAKSMVFFSMACLARLNYHHIIDFFNEKEEI